MSDGRAPGLKHRHNRHGILFAECPICGCVWQQVGGVWRYVGGKYKPRSVPYDRAMKRVDYPYPCGCTPNEKP